MKDDEVRVTFRIPRELWSRVQALATQENRSRNGQLVTLVSEAVDQHEANRNPPPHAR